jgi:fatty-acid peroxygenase
MSRDIHESARGKPPGLRLASSAADSPRKIPRDTSMDATLALLREPFRFIAAGCRRLHSDVFETRVLLRRTLCLTGPESAALFCDPAYFIRDGAVPRRILKTLFGVGGVQTLDGVAHRHRKALFMSWMTPERIAALRASAKRIWLERAAAWADTETVELYGEARGILTRAVCEWAGVPLRGNDEAKLARQFTCMFSSGKTIGPAHWRALRMRRQSEAWARGLVNKVRSGRLVPPPGSPLESLATWRDLDGEPLQPQIAAVELLNVLRPTVATAVWVVYVALSLHRYPEAREALRTELDYAEWFAQEVRRYYPFFPMVAARVRNTFEWHGYRFDKGTRVLLDLYGTDHDPRAWRNPEVFDPLRFRGVSINPFEFVPHGPGDPFRHHRCPGERIAIELMKMAARLLTADMVYEVPADQDLTIDWSELPALPRSRFLMSRVRRAAVSVRPALVYSAPIEERTQARRSSDLT